MLNESQPLKIVPIDNCAYWSSCLLIIVTINYYATIWSTFATSKPFWLVSYVITNPPEKFKHCCHNGPNFLFRSEFGLFAEKGSENGLNFVQKSEFSICYKNEPINHLPNRIFIISFSPKKKHINLFTFHNIKYCMI